MTATPKAPLFAGRALALVGIVLVAVNLRTAVGALSPLFTTIDDEIGVGPLGIGVLAMLPPLCFAAFGVFAPAVARRRSVESVLVVAIAALLAGHVVRALAGGFPGLVAGSALCFAGIGVANVVLPALVKKYFPDRIGQLTSVYATIMALSTMVPPLVAVPVAEAAGWRVSVGLWAMFALAALVPWVVELVRSRRPAGSAAPPVPEAAGVLRMARSRTAWALAAVFTTSSMNAYVAFGWLPVILQELAGVDAATAGVLLALFGAMGVPSALLVPVIVARTGRVRLLVLVGTAAFVAGYAGLLIAPATATALWVALIGSGPLLFPLALLLITLRSATPHTAVSLSSFVQSVGYLAAAVVPLGVGLLHDATGGWRTPLAIMLVVSLAGGLVGTRAARDVTVDDELAGRHP